MKIRILTYRRRSAGLLITGLLGLAVGCEPVMADFSGDFAPGNFQLTGGDLNGSNPPASIQLNGSVSVFQGSNALRFLRAAPANGRVVFNWAFGTPDPTENQFGFVQNGNLIQLTNNGAANQNGAAAFPVAAGQPMGFWLNGSAGVFSSTSASAAIGGFLFSSAVYWKGNTNGLWSAANWTLDQAGTVATAIPNAPMDVIFSATGAANKTTTLGQDFTVHNLTVQDGAAVTIGGANTLTVAGATTVSSGSLVLQGPYNAAAHAISNGAALELNVASGTRDYTTTSFSGSGTLRKTGAGTAQWGTGAAAFALGSGGLIDVQGGQLTGGSNGNEVWTNNLADLNVASGAVFNGVEANVRVDALTGTGTIRSGYPGAGYANFTFGVDNGSGSFGGLLTDSSAAGNFVKTGTGTQTLTSANTYTGSTTLFGNGSSSGGAITAGVSNALPSGTALTIGQPAIYSDARFNTGGFAHTISSLTIYGQYNGMNTVVDVGTGTLTLNGSLSLLDVTALPGNARGATIAAGAGGTLNLGGAVRNITVAGQGTGGPPNTATPGSLIVYPVVANGGINFTGNPSSSGQGPTGMTLGAGAPNTYALGTTVNAGTLNVAATTTLGAATGSLTLNTTGSVASEVALNSAQTIGSLATGALGSGTATVTLNAGALTVNQAVNTTFAGVIAGAGSLVKTGSGALTLTGANTYTGGTTVAGGTLSGAAPGPLTLTTTGAVASTAILSSAQTLTSLQSGALGSGVATLNLNGAAVTLNQSANTTFAGLVTGTGSLVKSGTGTLTLAGTNSYGGTTTISGGAITTAGRGLGGGAISVAGTLNVGGVAGLASLYFNTAPVAANFNSLDTLGAHLGALGTPNLVTNAPTLNFGTDGAGFPPPFNSGVTNMESYCSGILNVTNAGTYTFNTSTDDGSMLWVDGTLVVNNNFSQGVTTRSGSITLGTGAHTLVTAYYQGIGGYGMNAQISGPGNVVMEDIDSGLVNGLTVNSDLVVNSLGGAGNVNLQDGGLIVGVDSSNSTFTGVIAASGSGAAVAGLTKFGSGTLTLGGANTFNGRTTVNGGILQLNHANALQNSSLHPNLGNAVKFNTGIATFNVGGLEAAGSIALQNLSNAAITLSVGANAASTAYAGVLSGPGSLAKVGAGVLTLSGASSYTGGTTVSAGTLSANDTIAAGVSATGVGPVTVSGTGTLSGGNAAGTQGSVLGALTVNTGGVVAPGDAGTGIFTVNGNTVFNSGAKLLIEINGAAAGSGYDQIKANGSVNLGGATLSLSGSLVPTPGQVFTLVVNDGTDAITGTFNGLAEGATITFNGVALFVSYVGGGGNDVVLFAPMRVNTLADSGAGSLRQAIADAPSGSTIIFEPAIDGGTVTLGGTELLISKNLTIYGVNLSTGLTISGNHASRVFNIASGSVVALARLTITGGNAGGHGGGIFNAGTLTLNRTTLAGNTTANYGGAIYNESATGNLSLTNCTVSNNSANFGGGILSSGVVSLTHTTLTGNRAATDAGGMAVYGGTAALNNTIVARNVSPLTADIALWTGSLTPSGINLVGINSTVATQFPAGPLAGTAAAPIDPRLAPLGNYGGPTPTMPPLVGSPAINAGGATSLSVDQRGFPRVLDGKTPGGSGTAVADLGAVEAGRALLVSNNLGDSSAGSLRLALANATVPGDRILFNLASASSTIALLTNGELAVSANRTVFLDASKLVDASGVARLENDPIHPGSQITRSGVTVSGSDNSRGFNVASGGNLALQNLTVTHGHTGSGGGGGIANSGTLTLVNCTISACFTSGRGGGLYSGGIASLIQSTVSGNTANDVGGGILNAGSSLMLRSCTLAGNTSLGTTGLQGFGGGIFNFAVPLSLINCTLSGNTAATRGGGIRTQGGAVTLENTLIAGNSAPTQGPDIANAGAMLVSTGANLVGNNAAVTVEFPAGPLVGTAADPLDAHLGPLADNGGPTQTMMLMAGSPALDVGVVSAATPFTDQRGFTRNLAGGLDIGAYEAAADNFTLDGLTVYARVPGATNVKFQISSDPNFLVTVSTLAGTGTAGSTDGPRAAAQFSYASGVAQDAEGNVFIADTNNHQIRMLSPAGDVTTIAGTTTFGFANGSGPSARFAFPAAVAVGPDDNLYVADTFNHRIRKLTRPLLDGQPWTVTTLAGSGTAGFLNGVGTAARFNHPQGLVLDSGGNVYVADTLNHRIRMVTSAGVVSTYAGTGAAAFLDGAATAAKFNSPFGVDLDSAGNLFVADRDNQRIRKIDHLTLVVSTVAGNGSAGFTNAGVGTFSSPVAVAVDRSSNLVYVSDESNHAIRMVTSAGVVTTVAGLGSAAAGYLDGNALLAEFHSPSGLLVDPDGNLIVADIENHTLRRVRIRLEVSATLAGADPDGFGVPASALINAAALGLDPGATYYIRWRSVTDGTLQSLGQSFVLIAPPSVVTGNATNLTATSATLNATVNPEGSPTTTSFEYSTDPNLVVPIAVSATPAAAGSGTSDVAASGSIPGPLLPTTTYYYRAVATNGRGKIYGDTLSFITLTLTVVTEAATNLTLTAATLNATVDPVGSPTTVKFTYSTDPDLLAPYGVTTRAGAVTAGNVDSSNPLSARFNTPEGVASFGGNVFVVDRLNHRIRRIAAGGTVSTFAGSTAGFIDAGTGTSARFDHPSGVAVDSGGTLYVADEYNHRIRKVTPSGSVSTVAGSGVAGFADGAAGVAKFLFPTGVALDAVGDIYVADSGNHRIRMIAPDGTVSTVAGTGVAGLVDDAATSAQFNVPLGVVVGAGGALFVSDSQNHCIRKIGTDGKTSTFAGSSVAGYADGSAGDAGFATPAGIAVDGSGVLYVTDRDDQRIRRIAADGMVSTLAGSGIAGWLDTPVGPLYPATAAKFNLPGGITVDADGSLLVTETGNHDLRRIRRAAAVPTLTASPLASGFGLRLVSMAIPETLMSRGTYYFQASGTNAGGAAAGAILSFTTPSTQAISVFDGPDTASPALTHAQPAAVDFGSTPLGMPVTRHFTIANAGEWPLHVSAVGASAVGYQCSGGTGVIAAGSSANFTVTLAATAGGTLGGNIEITSDDPARTTFAFPVTSVVFNPPAVAAVLASNATATGVTLSTTVNPLGSSTAVWFEYSTNPGFDGVRVSTLAGAAPGHVDGASADSRFKAPRGLATDAAGNIYVADTLNHCIRQITPAGVVSTYAGTGVADFLDGPAGGARFNEPVGVVVGHDGTVFVADSQNHRIRAISPDGQVSTYSGLGDPGYTDGVGSGARFNVPKGLAIDAAGNLYVADVVNQAIRKVALDGSVGTLMGTTGQPGGVAVNAGGVVYFSAGNFIRRIAADGTVSDFAGNFATASYLDGVGSAARFASPTGLTCDASGNLYVADTGNQRIRKVAPDGTVTTVAGTGTAGLLDGLGEVARFDSPVAVMATPAGDVLVGELTHATLRQLVSTTVLVPAASGLSGSVGVPVSVVLTGLDPGVAYYFLAIATNAGGTSSSSVLSGAMAGGSPFQSWQSARFGGDANNPLIAGPLANPSHDGMPNLIKYALGLDPNLASPGAQPLPVLAAGTLSFTYTQIVAASDLTYTAEWSSDLQTWSAAGVTTAILSDDGVHRQIRASVPLGAAKAKFLHLNVSLTQP